MNEPCDSAMREDISNPSCQLESGNNCWSVVASVDLDDYLPSQHFFNGMKVLIDRPHVVNPKVFNVEIVTIEDVPFVNSVLSDYLTAGKFCEDSLKNFLKDTDYSDKPPIQNKEKNQGQVIIRHVLPKQFNKYKEVLEVVVLDYIEESASFFPKKSDVLNCPLVPSCPYKFRMIDKRIQLEVFKCLDDENMKTAIARKWLSEKVLPKVARWCQIIPKHTMLPSIQLVQAKDYNAKLHDLKAKYAKKFVEIWPTYNTTDPIKYVYEDISIAAYLITLWAQERKKLNIIKKQTFVDLGCGNGLLDHILQSEGHKGIGIDIRKRKIWNIYGPETKLIEMAIEPSDQHKYPDYDWIIGNHPDELTPWIPVIAARSSYHMRVFLLPCCFYTFDGKYARTHQDFTQYQSYINFIKLLCETMGFHVQLDRLRIPSTKRTCLVCFSRNYEEDNEAKLEITRRDFIQHNSKNGNITVSSVQDDTLIENATFVDISTWAPMDIDIDTDRKVVEYIIQESFQCIPDCSEANMTPKWVDSFVPRESVECPQNCTGLDKKVIDEAIMTIVKALLATENYVSIQKDTGSLSWNKGGTLKMANIFHLLNQQALTSMKNQSGGFQTLIRNHQNIFEVNKDTIQLRIPSINVLSDFENSITYRKKRGYKKTKKQDDYHKKKCFFHFHHPQGCPLSAIQCTYSHEELLMR